MITNIGTGTEQMSHPTWKLTVADANGPVVHDGLSRADARIALSAVVRGLPVPVLTAPPVADRDSDFAAASAA